LGKIDRSFKRRLMKEPETKVRLIVRTRDEPKTYRSLLARRGIKVKRELALIKALAIECEASAALALLREGWVVSLEEDSEVRALT